MYCPQCGQQQVSGAVRFCSRCGFPLDGVIQLLANGGMVPVYRASDEPVVMSPRRKGVKQGAILFLSGAVIVPLLGIIASFSSANFPSLLTALAAVICFIGGPFRMLYAALFEEGAPPRLPIYGPPPVATPQFVPPRPNAALPPPPVPSPSSWRRPTTGELANRPSVTENTTRLLDKEDQTDR